MGTWGTGLYQNDSAADLKADFALWAGLDWAPDQLLERLAQEAGLSLGKPCEDADQSGFWLALTDLFHQHGFEHPALFKKAKGIIDDGTDLRLLEELEMDAPELKRRAKVLQDLKTRWIAPPKRVKSVKLLKEEPALMETGDLMGYPTMQNSARITPLTVGEKANYQWDPDGYGAFVVLKSARVFQGIFVRYFIAPLLCFGDTKRTLEDCLETFFINEVSVFNRTFTPVGGWAEIAKKDLKLIEAEKVGHVDLDTDRVSEMFPETSTEPGVYGNGRLGYLDMGHSVWDSRLRGSNWGELEDTFESLVLKS